MLQGVGMTVWGGFGDENVWFEGWGLGFMIQGLGSRVEGGLRIRGVGVEG